MPDLMTTSEVAEYLRLKERTIYELVRTRRIPHVRVTGKLLFPKQMVDLWVASHADYDAPLPRVPPPVIAGSHDPLLEWAARESGSELALLGGGSMDGLARILGGSAALAGIHIFDRDSDSYNTHAVKGLPGALDIVLIEFARRSQGLITLPANPLGLTSLADVAARRARLAQRQEGAGAQILLRQLVAAAGLDFESLALVPHPFLSETELAAAIADGKADCGLGIAAGAKRLRLGFLPLHEERFDLALRRRDFFEPPVQRLMAFCRSPAFAEKARELGGYDVSGCGCVRYNA